LLSPKNRKVLAYIREHDDDTVLCVVNLAHSLKRSIFDLSHFLVVPVEPAPDRVPPIETSPTSLCRRLVYWFALATADDQPTWHTPAPEPLPELVTMIFAVVCPKHWSRLRCSS
jgi:maltose alpha-D-glucosyltransferase/alpha-amylase